MSLNRHFLALHRNSLASAKEQKLSSDGGKRCEGAVVMADEHQSVTIHTASSPVTDRSKWQYHCFNT
jgi:hypothetical protein